MNERITFIGSIANDLLQSGHGCVFAVFENSIYLESAIHKDPLFCIGTSQLVRGPINVISNYNSLPTIAVGAPWRQHSEQLFIGTNAIHCPKAISSDRNHKTQSNIVWPDIETINHLTNTYTYNQSDNRFQNQLNERLNNGVEQLNRWLHSDGPVPTELLGCGHGLTPSGDDILIGALIALDYIGCTNQFSVLANGVQSQAPLATNRVSLAHLRAATCHGMAVELLHDFIAALFGKTDALPDAITNLTDYGHQSGHDAVIGVLAVACALYPARIEDDPHIADISGKLN